MAQLAVMKKATEAWTPITQYDENKWSLGDLIKKRTDIGATPFIGPCVGTVARPVEQSAAIPGVYPYVIQWVDRLFRYSTGTVGVTGTTVTGSGTQWMTTGITLNVNIGFGSTNPAEITTWYNIESLESDTGLTLSTIATTYTGGTPYVIENFKQIDWVFLCDNAAAAITRRIQLYEYDRMNTTWGWRGFITITPTATATHTHRALQMGYEKYHIGTVSVTNQYVTGSGSLWVDDRMCKAGTTMGSRIGFGSTDPTQIKTWYYTNTITGNTAMTISTNVGTAVSPTLSIAAGTPYVIEDLRVYMVTTNTTNGGLFVAKGLSYADFTSGGTTIPIGAGTDNLKQTYWLKDATTILNVTGCGLAMEPKIDWVTQYVYVLDSATMKIFKYNIRKALTLAGAIDLTAFQYATGNQAVTGTLSPTNNGKYAVVNHGPAKGIPSLYFVTTTRIYCTPTSAITQGSTTFLQYTMTEVPPGGVVTYAATGALACIEYSSSIDRFVIMSTGGSGARSYVTQFRTDATPIDHIFLIDSKQLDQSTADGNIAIHPSVSALTHTPWSEGGMLYLASIGTTQAANFLHAVPIGAEWTYASTTHQRAITPVINTPNCVHYIGAYAWRDNIIGSDTLGKRADAFRTYYRTTGISDNTGLWDLLPEPPDMSAIEGSPQIQFMHEFRCITDYCIPGRIFGTGIIYEDSSNDSHYRYSGTMSSGPLKQFAFRFVTAFGTNVPTLRIRLYNDVTGTLLVDDNTASPSGTWAKSTNDGGVWGSYNATDKTNETTYIRYTPSSLGDNLKVRSLLTLY